MGNCTCSKVKEENDSQYDDDYLDMALDEIMGDILRPPYQPRFADLISELDDDEDDYVFDDDDDDDDGSLSELHRHISFERDSNISRLENIFIEGEVCGICAFNFDEAQHAPRIIPCGHTFCHYCIRKMAKRYKYKYLKCPLDRKRHHLKHSHTNNLLRPGQSSSTESVASDSGSIGIVLDLELFHHVDVDSDEDDTDFAEVDNDVTSNEENEGDFLNLNILPPNYNTPDSDNNVLHNLLIKPDDVTSKYAVQHSYVESEDSESDSNELESDTLHTNQQQSLRFQHIKREPSWSYVNGESSVMDSLHNNQQQSLRSQPIKREPSWSDVNEERSEMDSLHSNQQQSLRFQPIKREPSWSDVNEEKSDVLSEFSDIIYLRQKQRSKIKSGFGNTDQDGIYDDERSVRSFEWMEPDYD